MNTNTRASGLAFAIGLALSVNVPLIHADVTLEERLAIGGAQKFANMSGRTVTTIAGDRSRSESDFEMDSKLVRTFTRDMGPTAEIVRLDQEKVYLLDLRKKEYSELSFAEARARWEKMLEHSKRMRAQHPQASGAPVDESQCEWSEPKAQLRRSGEKAAFAGYEGTRITVSATQACKSKESGAVCDFTLTLDQWLAPDFPPEAETLRFYKSYADKMGLSTVMSREVAQQAESLFGGYKDLWKEVGAKLRDVKGYPLKTVFDLGVGGPQCRGSDSPADGAPPTEEEAKEAAATAAGETAGEAAFGGIAGKVGGKLAGSLFGKKKKEEAAAGAEAPATEPAPAPTPAAAAPGTRSLIGLSAELLAVKRDAASAGAFEVPAGFRKVAVKQ